MRKKKTIYQAYRGPSRTGRIALRALLCIAAAAALLVLAAILLFWRELSLARAVSRLDTARPAYLLEIRGDYHFEEFLSAGGARSDGEVSAFLTEKISRGFYRAPVEGASRGCSVLAARGADGGLLWGRNYDWTGAVPVLVRHIPEEGYASLSTCDFQNVTGSPESLPEGMTRLLAPAALYVPLDGVNEAGLCVADLEVNEGGMPDPDTEKPDLTVTTAIRLLLNRAATVEEALDLLARYDIHPSGGISHHLAIADRQGASVSVEFTEEGFTAVPAQAVTNFNLASGDVSAGGESARRRYEVLTEYLAKGLSGPDEVRDALAAAVQPEGEWTTQWSMVYDRGTVVWYFDGDFTRSIRLPILDQ